MTGGFPHILARGDNGMEFVIGVIVFIIWAISALGQAATKQKKKQQQQESQQLREIRERIEAERRQAARSAQRINPNIARRQRAVLAPPAPIVTYGRTPMGPGRCGGCRHRYPRGAGRRCGGLHLRRRRLHR